MGLLQILSRRPGKAKTQPDVSQQSQSAPSIKHRTSVLHVKSGGQQLGGHSPPQPQPSRPPSSSAAASVKSFDMKPRPPFLISSPRTSPDLERPATSSSMSHGVFPSLVKGTAQQQRPQRGNRRPPVSFRKPSSLLSMSSAYQESAPPASEKPGRSMSMSSTRSARSKDLLDALEEIKTVEFRTRVLATGARDYGEDVADRNIRLSRTFVSSPDLKDHQRPFDRSHQGSITSHTSQASTPLMSPAVSSPAISPPQHASEFGSAVLPHKRNKNRLSLNTYTPSGIDGIPHSPRSVVTMPGFRDAAIREVVSPSADNLSRRYCLSPTGSNFSVPRSPRVVDVPTIPETVADTRIERHDFAEDQKEQNADHDDHDATPTDTQRASSSSVGHITTKQAGRFSDQTIRSSVTSSIASRYPSGGDITPLGCPKLRSKSPAPQKRNEDSLQPRSRSLHSHRHSRSNSSEDSSHLKTRTKSLTTHTTGLRDLVEIDEAIPTTPSNGSTTSSSNRRPFSRHTKAGSSIDSTRTSGWSPATTKSTTGFNIDDYISSDSDSFVEAEEKKKRKPTADGEEELLFKTGYGESGAALPGLLDDGGGACPAPEVPMRHLLESDEPLSYFSEDEDDDHDENLDDDVDDAASEDRELPVTLLRHVRNRCGGGGGGGGGGTFGRRSRRPQALATNSAAAAAGTPMEVAEARAMSYRRGQKRLSALGTLHGRPGDVEEQPSMMTFEEEDEMDKEKVDPATAMRLRKEAKARKRAEGTRNKRMTRAFGDAEVEAVLEAVHAEEGGLDRGRGLVREGVVVAVE